MQCVCEKGFGVFSVSRSAIDAVARYFENQEAYHRKYDLFRSDFLSLLEKNEVDSIRNIYGKRYSAVSTAQSSFNDVPTFYTAGFKSVGRARL